MDASTDAEWSQKKLSAARRALSTPVGGGRSHAHAQPHPEQVQRLSSGSQRRRNKRAPPLEETLYASLETVVNEQKVERSARSRSRERDYYEERGGSVRSTPPRTVRMSREAWEREASDGHEVLTLTLTL